MNSFDEIMQYCPFLKGIIENKIKEEIATVKNEKEKEITELKTTIENLTATVLMGGK